MDLQTFKAQTMAEALAQVKSTMGHDAVILHTRTYQMRRWLGLRRRDVVEVTAGRGLNFARRPRNNGSNGNSGGQSQQTPARKVIGADANGLIYGPGLSRRSNDDTPALAPQRGAVEGARQLMETPAAGNALMLSVGKDMVQLKQMVEKLVLENRQSQSPQVPEVLFDHYTRLVSSEVAVDLAQDICRTMQRELRPEYLTQDSYVRDKIAEHIEGMIPSSGPIVRKQTPGPHVIALVGPTGVGKTTTLAKLAANLKLKEHFRIGLITLDTYRIAAVDQLKRYANILQSPLKVVGSPDELLDAMAFMSNMDFVLIDTAGRSPNDAIKINELRDLLGTIQPDEVHLVLSSTASTHCMELAVERFNDVRVDKVIITKLDEAAHVGGVLTVIKKINKSLSYVTTGQDVPNDIEVGRGRMLARMILGEAVKEGFESSVFK